MTTPPSLPLPDPPNPAEGMAECESAPGRVCTVPLGQRGDHELTGQRPLSRPLPQNQVTCPPVPKALSDTPAHVGVGEGVQ